MTMPKQSSPVKSLNALVNYGNELNQYFSPNVGPVIRKDTVVSIMEYLDERFNYSSKVFPEKMGEAVFFHELGHALHGAFSGGIQEVPDGVFEILRGSCFKTIYEANTSAQVEILADVLSVGLMYDSPFIKYDPFSFMNDDARELFHHLTVKMLDRFERVKKIL